MRRESTGAEEIAMAELLESLGPQAMAIYGF